MIPKSRERRRGAYRNLVPNIINGEIEETELGNSVGNTVDTTRVVLETLSLGDFNKIELYKRNISAPLCIPYVATSNVIMGSKNTGKISLMHVNVGSNGKPRDNAGYDLGITAGSNNVMDFYITDIADINIGSGNNIEGSTTAGNIEIGDNNYLVDFKAKIPSGTAVKGLAREGSLMFTTEVTEYAGVGQNYIEVEDISLIPNDCEFYFGSVSAGFVRRIATKTVDGKVYFDNPLLFKESTFPGAQVFNEYIEIQEPLITNLLKEAPYRSKRLYLPLEGSFHLRKLIVNGTFETTLFFHRESDNLAIVKDLTPSVIPNGASVVSPEINPYREWTTSVNQNETSGNEYTIGVTNLAFVGRTTVIDSVEYTIDGYTENTLFISPELPDGTTHITFPEIDSSPAGSTIESVVSVEAKGAIDRIEVSDASGFFVGQSVKIDGVSKVMTIGGIVDKMLIFDSSVFPSRLDNRFFVGGYEMPSTRAEAEAEIALATADVNNYLFGD